MVLETKTLLSCENISKNFDGVQALKDVSFKIHPGKVHGLVGENGAGKSTLVKIISGAYRSDKGKIFLNGKHIQINNPEEMLRNGVATIYQDINLIENMTVEENIFLNNELKYKFGNFIKSKETRKQALELFKEYKIEIDPKALVSMLPNDIKKIIQTIKAVNRNAKILLMDEPTSSLTSLEEKQILDLIRKLSESGVGIVFISHYLSEVFKICDYITVLRNGEHIDTVETKNTNIEDIVKMMIGRKLRKTLVKKENYSISKKILAVNDLTVKGKLESVSFDLYKGEVLGITGLVGSGSSELAKVLFGSIDLKKESGNFIINGKKVQIRHPKDAIKNGFAFITDDRLHEGLLFRRPLYENICLSTLSEFTNRALLLSEKDMILKSNDYIKLLDIKTPNSLVNAQNLSGGNQQKVLFAKGLQNKPKIFILSEPTIGIDIGTKYEIRRLISDMASRGVSIILVTTELEELEKLCDRVLIMFRGEIIKEFKGNNITKENILEASTGGVKKNGKK